MNAELHEIADHRPHALVIAQDGPHVIPHTLLHSIIKGDKPSSILTEPVVRRIIEEWLERTKA